MTEDFDFHPDEPTVRVFVTPPAALVRLDDEVAIIEVRDGGVVLRHYAFRDRWFKVNVTTDLEGRLVESGDAANRFALNCDIATPMERDGDAIFAVDLFADVLIRADARRYRVGDMDELEDAPTAGLISAAEAAAAHRGLVDLLELVDAGHLLPWLAELHPFGPCDPPPALPMERCPVPGRLQAGHRPTW